MFEPFNQINPINLIISSVLFVFVFIFFIVKLNEVRKKIQDNRVFLTKTIDGQINKINSEFVTMDTLKRLISENDFSDPSQPEDEEVIEDIKEDISYDNPSIPSVPIENDPDLEEEFEEDSSDSDDIKVDIK